MARKPTVHLLLAPLLATASIAGVIASVAPQPAAAHGWQRYPRWHHSGYGGGSWIRAGFFYASAPGFYPGVGWVGYAPPPAYAVPSYAVPGYVPSYAVPAYPDPAYYAGPAYYAAPAYYAPPPVYYGPAYGGPHISIGISIGNGHGWRR